MGWDGWSKWMDARVVLSSIFLTCRTQLRMEDIEMPSKRKVIG